MSVELRFLESYLAKNLKISSLSLNFLDALIMYARLHLTTIGLKVFQIWMQEQFCKLHVKLKFSIKYMVSGKQICKNRKIKVTIVSVL